jgi:type I restriction enzyme S subunit
VTWSDETQDREDPEFYQPEYLELERILRVGGAMRLDEVATFSDRTWVPSQTDTPFSYIDIASVNIRTGDVQSVELPEAEAPSRARRKVREGDLIVSTVRPERNAVALIHKDLDGAVCSTGFTVLRPMEGVDAHALYAFLKSRYFICQAVRRSTASMYPAVAEECLREVLVPRPVIDLGKQLGAVVRTAFAEQQRFLARLREVAGRLEELVSAGE